MSSTLTLNSNLASLSAQRRLAQSTATLQSTFEHLSSGLRITKASDDAAGLAIASSLNVDGRVYSQATRNTNDAVSLYSIAEGALDSLVDISTRLKELAQQSSNGVLSYTQRKSLDSEAQALGQEYRRIVWTTQFNGNNLFDNTNGPLSVQAGYNALSLSGGIAPTGTFAARVSLGLAFATETVTGDLNGDGKIDIVAAGYFTGSLAVYIANGDGTFVAPVAYTETAGNSHSLALADFNNDGIIDLLSSRGGKITALLGNGNGTFKAPNVNITPGGTIWSVSSADVTGDGKADIVATDLGSGNLNILVGNGDGTFKVSQTLTTAGGSPQGVLATDINGDGRADIVVADGGSSSLSFYLSNGNGTFARKTVATNNGPTALAQADVNGDGRQDLLVAEAGFNDVIVLLANGDGTFLAKQGYQAGLGPRGLTIADFNGDGRLDVGTYDGSASGVQVLFGNGNGTFKANVSYFASDNPGGIASADLNGDGRIDLVTADGNGNQLSVYFGNGVSVGAYAPQVGFYSLLTQQDSRSALTQFTGVINSLTSALGTLGANSSRLDIVTNVLKTSRENYLQAASQIQDVDVASEAAQLTKTQILQQAGAAILAQANQQPQIVLSLLGHI